MDTQTERFQEIPYTHANFPIEIRECSQDTPSINTNLHWHTDLQFTACLVGRITLSIEGTLITLEKDEMVFINRNILHQVLTLSDDARYIELDFAESIISFHPESVMNLNYVKPYTHSTTTAGFLLNQHSEWELNILRFIKEIYTLQHSDEDSYNHYQIAWQLVHIWLLISQNISESMILHSGTSKSKRYLELIQSMLAFIYDYYGEKIKLSDIAESGHVSPTECSRVFKKFTNQSPYQFLMNHRLKMSLNYLVNSPDMTVFDICKTIGFEHPSNYIRKFTEKYGTTPLKYRKNHQQLEQEKR